MTDKYNWRAGKKLDGFIEEQYLTQLDFQIVRELAVNFIFQKTHFRRCWRKMLTWRRTRKYPKYWRMKVDWLALRKRVNYSPRRVILIKINRKLELGGHCNPAKLFLTLPLHIGRWAVVRYQIYSWTTGSQKQISIPVWFCRRIAATGFCLAFPFRFFVWSSRIRVD